MEEEKKDYLDLPRLEETYRRAVEIVQWNIEELEGFLDGEGYPEETSKWVVGRIKTLLVSNYETDCML